MFEKQNMDRRSFLKYASVAAGAGIFSGCGDGFLSGASSKLETRQYQNVVYVLLDDAGYGDFSCFGQKHFTTPNIDALADQGMKFTDYYAGSTVCAPSRCSLMTGLHTGHCFICGNKSFEGFDYPIPDKTYTVAELFKESGYKTACIGKWGLGGPENSGRPRNQGFDYFYGYYSQRKAHCYYPDYLWRNEEKIELDGTVYSHDKISQEVMSFVKSNADNPFFLYYAATIPHAEMKLPEKYMKEFIGVYPEKPYIVTGGTYGSQKTPKAAFAAMMKRMDKDLGDLKNLLVEMGLDKNTLIIVTSDNGPHHEGGHDPVFFDSNGPLRGFKRDLYEGGIRVPMIAWMPGKIKAGSVSDHVSAFWDFLPTCADLLNKKAPSDIDGISYLPTLFGSGRQPEHEYLYWEFHEQGGKQAVRLGKWKGIRLNVFEDPAGPIELYNIQEDIGETNNVADRHPNIVKRINKIMWREHVESEVFPFYKGKMV